MKELKKMKRIMILCFVTLSMVFLAGCATNNLTAPCPDYGKHCNKIQINSWDYNHH